MNKTITAILVAGLLLGAVATAAAKEPLRPAQEDETSRLVIANGEIILRFQGKKPMIDVLDATNLSRGYKVFLLRLVELAPADATGQEREAAVFELAKAEDWESSSERDAAGVHLTISRAGPMKVLGPLGRGGPPVPEEVRNLTRPLEGNETVRNASVSIVFHLYATPRTLTAGNETIEITTHEVKFDLVIDRWDFVNEADVVALEFLLVERGGGNASDMDSGNETHAANHTIDVNDDGTRVGWFGWVPTATATTGNDTTEVAVDHVPMGRSEGNATGDENGTEPAGARHALVYDAPGFDRLSHDPSIGVEPSEPLRETGFAGEVPGFGAALLVLAAPAAAIALVTRRRR